MKLRYVSLFSGIEAASAAWIPLGWEAVAFSEIEPFPCALLAERYPNVPNLGDITKIDWKKELRRLGEVDVVIGGSPCQSFSVAGKREGLEGESRLMFEYIRAIQEIRPKTLLWENVPGALTSDDGRAFEQLLSCLDELGYGLAWKVLDAQYFGVAQRRRRVFLVGCLGDPERAAEILFEPESLRWDHPSSREKRKELAGDAEIGVGCRGGECDPRGACGDRGIECDAGSDGGGQPNCLTAWDCQSKRIFEPNGPAPTLQAGADGGGRWPTVCYALQGNMIGRDDYNGPQGDGVNEDVSFTLNTTDRHAVAFETPPSHCLPFNLTQITSPQCGSNPKWDDPCHTLSATDRPPHVICTASTQANAEVDYDLCGTLTHRSYKDAPVVCMADDNANAAVDEDLCGSLKVGGGVNPSLHSIERWRHDRVVVRKGPQGNRKPVRLRGEGNSHD